MPSLLRMCSTWRRSLGLELPRRSLTISMWSPCRWILPDVGISSRLMQRRKVLLPEPDAPRIEITSCSLAVREMPRSTSTVPKDLWMSSTTSVVEASLFMALPHAHDGVRGFRRCVAGKMRIEKLLEIPPAANEQPGDHQVNYGGPEIDREIKCLGEYGFRFAHQVEDGDYAGDCASLHEQDDLIAKGRLGNAVGVRQD